MAVYFIRNGNYIKIGKSVDPWKRLASLQTAHHDKLEILAIMPGSDDLEAGLHRSFGSFMKRGEWFEQNDQLLAFIGVVKATFPDMQQQYEAQPEPGCCGRPQNGEMLIAGEEEGTIPLLALNESRVYRMTHKGHFRAPDLHKHMGVNLMFYNGGYWKNFEDEDWLGLYSPGLRFEFVNMQHFRVTRVGDIYQGVQPRYCTVEHSLKGLLSTALKNAIYNRKNTGPWLGVYNDSGDGSIVIAIKKRPLRDSYVQLDVPDEVIDYWRQYHYKSPLPEGVTIEA